MPTASSEDSSSNEVAVNYTISSPLRKSFRASVEKDEDNDDDQKISATFTIAPPPKPTTNCISLLATRLEKGIEHEAGANSVTATINVPLITNKNTIGMDISDKLKKTDQPSPTSPIMKPVPQPRSLFDIDNATSIKLADKLQQEAKKCDANAINDAPFTAVGEVEPLPPSPIHHTIFGERRTSWRLKYDNSSKVNDDDLYTKFKMLMWLMRTNWQMIICWKTSSMVSSLLLFFFDWLSLTIVFTLAQRLLTQTNCLYFFSAC